MSYARVVTSSIGQHVELPDDVRLAADEVEVLKEGETLTLRPSGRSYGERLVASMDRLSDLIERPDELPPQSRPGL